MTQEPNQKPRAWADEAEEALNRIGDALKAAWEGTREARTATLEAAREAASRLGEAIDQGIASAKETWETSPDDQEPADEATTRPVARPDDGQAEVDSDPESPV